VTDVEPLGLTGERAQDPAVTSARRMMADDRDDGIATS
jgi:hypothetical protein